MKAYLHQPVCDALFEEIIASLEQALLQHVTFPKRQLKWCKQIHETYPDPQPSLLSLNNNVPSPFPSLWQYFHQSKILKVDQSKASLYNDLSALAFFECFVPLVYKALCTVVSRV